LPLFTSILVNNFASTIKIVFPSWNLLKFTSSQPVFSDFISISFVFIFKNEIKRIYIKLIFGVVNKKESLQRVKAMKIVIKSSAHFILDSVEKRAHYVVEILNGVLE